MEHDHPVQSTATLHRWLATILSDGDDGDGMSIMRLKGVIAVAGMDRRLMVQCVNDMFGMAFAAAARARTHALLKLLPPQRMADTMETTAWEAGEARRTRLLVVGRNLHEPKLRETFVDMCCS